MPSPKNHLSSTPTVSGIARQHGVSRNTVQKWRDEGLNLGDRKAVAAKVSAMASRSSPDLQAARLAKIEAETIRIRHAHEVESGRYVDAAAMQATGYKIGATIRAALDELTQSLPPQLAGHDAAKIHAILKREHRRVMQRLSDNPTQPIQSPEP